MCCNVQYPREGKRMWTCLLIQPSSHIKSRMNKCSLRALWSKLEIYLCFAITAIAVAMCSVRKKPIYSVVGDRLWRSLKFLALNFSFVYEMSSLGTAEDWFQLGEEFLTCCWIFPLALVTRLLTATPHHINFNLNFPLKFFFASVKDCYILCFFVTQLGKARK